MEAHPVYFYTWVAFVSSHILIFWPFLYSWIVLSMADEVFDVELDVYSIEWSDEDIEFYKSMLLDNVLAFGPFVWLLLVLSFTGVLY